MLRIDLVGLLKANTVVFLSGLIMTLMLPACKTDASPKMRASIKDNDRLLHITSLDDKPFTIIGVTYNRGNRNSGVLKNPKWEALLGLTPPDLSTPEECAKNASSEVKPFLAETKKGEKVCAYFRTFNFGSTITLDTSPWLASYLATVYGESRRSDSKIIEVEIETDRGTATFKFQ